MAATSRFSLWLVPEPPTRDALQATIDRLSQQHGGPAFPPHVTLLGSISLPEAEVVARVRRLAAEIPPLPLPLDGIGREDVYFRSLYAVVQPTPGLLAARAAAERAFPEEAPAPYMPHLSLLYGPQPDAVKDAITTSLRDALPAGIEARQIVVYRTGEVKDWRHVLTVETSG